MTYLIVIPPQHFFKLTVLLAYNCIKYVFSVYVSAHMWALEREGEREYTATYSTQYILGIMRVSG